LISAPQELTNSDVSSGTRIAALLNDEKDIEAIFTESVSGGKTCAPQ